MKILALVKFNSGIAMVLDEAPKLTYKKAESVILGSDGTFLQTYFYDRPSPGWEAFAGRKFDLIMEDGSVEHCYGQWWDGVMEGHRKMVDGDIISVTAASIDHLRECYVFCGYKGVKHKIDELLAAYKGMVYEYWDFEMLITKNPYRRRKHVLLPLLSKLRRQQRQRRSRKLFKKQ